MLHPQAAPLTLVLRPATTNKRLKLGSSMLSDMVTSQNSPSSHSRAEAGRGREEGRVLPGVPRIFACRAPPRLLRSSNSHPHIVGDIVRKDLSSGEARQGS